MKKFRFILIVLLTAVVYSNSYSQGYHVRIGTIGNSITHGVVLPDPLTQAFPVQLNDMLTANFGDTCIVKNFGLTTTTMLKKGDVSYWNTQHFKDFLVYAPEICFIMLGTNDTKPQNWDVHGNGYIGITWQ
jgi:lysophospholipase L1-like esterase